MAASLKINDLPTAVDLNLTDRFLVSDIEADQAKTVTLESLTQNIRAEMIDGYDIIMAAINDVQETMAEVTGDFGTESITTLKDFHTMLEAHRASQNTVSEDLTRRLDILNDRITDQLLSNSSNLASLHSRLDTLEEANFHEGLATGTLFAQIVNVGEAD